MSHNGSRGIVAIEGAFAAAARQGRAALITYLTAGYPTQEATHELARALLEGGADLIELGVPFSDPVADGPVIQQASQQALEAGITPSSCLSLVAALRDQGVTVPLILMGYYNPILRYGPAAYAARCAQVGVDGLIIPDLPPEEAQPLADACAEHNIALVYLVAPTSSASRLAKIAAATSGFLYVVSHLGTTGGAHDLEPALVAQLAEIRRHARTPIAVGFGVSHPEAARQVAQVADGVIVGSAIVERAACGADAVRDLVSELRAALAH